MNKKETLVKKDKPMRKAKIIEHPIKVGELTKDNQLCIGVIKVLIKPTKSNEKDNDNKMEVNCRYDIVEGYEKDVGKYLVYFGQSLNGINKAQGKD